jgi:hypothetical protein
MLASPRSPASGHWSSDYGRYPESGGRVCRGPLWQELFETKLFDLRWAEELTGAKPDSIVMGVKQRAASGLFVTVAPPTY